MKRPQLQRLVRPFSRTLLGVALASTIACDAETIAGLLDDGPEPGFARVSGTIKDASGVPISGASVLLPFGVNQAWGSETDSKGKFQFDAQASDFAGVSPVAVVVFKDRYMPMTYYYSSVDDGDHLDVTPSAADAPRQLASNEFVPTNAHRLWHVGDESFSGSSNSQLQMDTFGQSIACPVTQWNATMRAQFRTATITYVARGVDTNRTSSCANRVGVFMEGTSQTSYATPSNSDANGGFSSYTITVSLPATFGDGRLMFAYISGACTSGDNGDDQEFGSVLVKLNP
jgi:hypothetical protein